ncbi:MAG: flagellar biosynthetic protein FliO [Nitrospinota bacterium]|nr:flagellar biosynthetic protein FliO [Nitrospinota bacterium]
MKKVLVSILLGFLFMVIGNSAEAIEGNKFENFSANAVGDDFRLEFTFENTPASQIKIMDKSAQIELKGAYVMPAKMTYELNKAGVKEVFIYQYDRETMRIRIFPQESMDILKKAISFVTEKGKITANINTNVAGIKPISETYKEITASTTGKSVKIPDAVAKAPVPLLKDNSAALIGDGLPEPVIEEPAKEAISDKQTADPSSPADGLFSKVKGDARISDDQSLDFLNYKDPAAPEDVPSMGNALLKVGSALLIVLSLIFIIAFLAKKYLNVAEGKLGGKRDIKIISSQYIGVKKQVTMVEVAGEILVLGVTSQSISILARYNDPEKIEQIKLENRLPKKPIGVAKKIPGMNWGVGSKKKPARKFDQEIENVSKKMDEDEITRAINSKDKLISSVAEEIAAKMKEMKKNRSAGSMTEAMA